MSTVDKTFADRIAAGNGWLDGDKDNSLGDNPRTVKIVEYDNAWGGKSYGLIFEGCDPDRYAKSKFVRNPRVYWEAK